MVSQSIQGRFKLYIDHYIKNIIFRLILLFILILLIVPSYACALTGGGSNRVAKAAKKMNSRAPNQETFFRADRAAIDRKVKEENTGSLWADSYTSRLYDNMYRASRVGDTVTIIVDEKSSALNKGDTKANKKSEVTNTIDNLGGLMTKLSSLISGLNPANLLTASAESKFKGDASTRRQGQLTAKITATVEDILRNGNMVIKGEQHLKVNKEEQVLVVEGIIRPYDILPDNTVLSSALADARISYTGFGIVAEKQSPGWLVRALDYIWPF